MNRGSTNHAGIFIAAGLAIAAAPSPTPASATVIRTFVSGLGSDSNPCTRTQPCRTFAFAIAQTTPGGEIYVLDPGGYGTLTIDRAISIVNDGVGAAGILVPSGAQGITINAGMNDTVSLRGLTIEGGGVGLAGIVLNSAKSVTIANCLIHHFTFDGISFLPTASSNFQVLDTTVADNDNDGIRILPSGSGTVTAFFNRVEMNNNTFGGIEVNGATSTGTLSATMSDSRASHNGTVGFRAFSNTGKAATTLMLLHSVAANNDIGLLADGSGATLRAARSTVTGNASGWQASGGSILQSYADNYIDGNAANQTAPTLVPGGRK